MHRAGPSVHIYHALWYICGDWRCGSVLALTALLCFSKSKQLKTIGRLGIVPAFFNISEPVIFGLPLMLNPVFFVPFLLTSVINGTAAYLTMQVGLIGKSFAMLSWQMPSVIGAFSQPWTGKRRCLSWC